MEIQKHQPTNLIQIKAKQELVAKYLPKDLLMQLKPMARAEVQSLMLKHCDDSQISIFSAKVINFINPKFNEGEFELAEADLYIFAKGCELTPDEFLLALKMAAEGKLSREVNGNNEKITLYKQIDQLSLLTIKSAYIELKKTEKAYNDDLLLIKSALLPEIKEKTPEELKEQRINFFIEDYKRLKSDGKVLGTVIFYDLIKKSGIETVKLKWLENSLERFKPTISETVRGNDFEKVKMPKIKENNAKTHFIDDFVNSFIKFKKLSELTQDEFVKYWNDIYENTPSS